MVSTWPYMVWSVRFADMLFPWDKVPSPSVPSSHGCYCRIDLSSSSVKAYVKRNLYFSCSPYLSLTWRDFPFPLSVFTPSFGAGVNSSVDPIFLLRELSVRPKHIGTRIGPAFFRKKGGGIRQQSLPTLLVKFVAFQHVAFSTHSGKVKPMFSCISLPLILPKMLFLPITTQKRPHGENPIPPLPPSISLPTFD